MRLKLDENIDTRLSVLLRQAGHEAIIVRDQGLYGTVDPEVYDHCISGGYVFVTLDLDFSNVLWYPFELIQGLVVLRGLDDLFLMVTILILTLVNALTMATLSGHLWIVELGRIRIHE